MLPGKPSPLLCSLPVVTVVICMKGCEQLIFVRALKKRCTKLVFKMIFYNDSITLLFLVQLTQQEEKLFVLSVYVPTYHRKETLEFHKHSYILIWF